MKKILFVGDTRDGGFGTTANRAYARDVTVLFSEPGILLQGTAAQAAQSANAKFGCWSPKA